MLSDVLDSRREENIARYANSAYDTLLSVIAAAGDETARLGCLHDAEALLLEDAAVAPLYTTVTRMDSAGGSDRPVPGQPRLVQLYICDIPGGVMPPGTSPHTDGSAGAARVFCGSTADGPGPLPADSGHKFC